MQTIHQLLQKGQLALAFQLLQHLLESNTHQKALSALKTEYNQLQDEHLKELIEWEAYVERRQGIINELTQLSRHFQLTDTGELGSWGKHVTPILAITFDPKEIEKLEDFFAKFAFTQVDVRTWNENPGFDNYKIIVFDNTDLMDEQEAERSNLRISQENKRSDRIIQMDYCVSRSACFILHYGNQFSWVNENRARAHAANSKFALYARLKELVDFIEAYRV